MKKIGLLMLMLCLTGLTVGCEKKEPAAPPAAPPATDTPDGGTAAPATDPAS
jgi:hypothetical protein